MLFSIKHVSASTKQHRTPQTKKKHPTYATIAEKIVNVNFNPIQGGGQKRLRTPSLLNFDKNNPRMRL